MSFLPVNREEMLVRGWDELDFLFISGDAYVDHPSFGHAIITRLLESEGYRIGIVPQPDWKKNEDFLVMGKPRLAVLISSGVIDSMVNHYTANKKRRSEDKYSPGGNAGLRPDRAVIVYSNKVREVFGEIPIIIGGIEASLRRFAHYDYWSDKVRRSILFDAKADLLVYGMGEKPILDIAAKLKNGLKIDEITFVPQTAYIAKSIDKIRDNHIIVPSFEEVKEDKRKYAEAFSIEYIENDPYDGKIVIQPHGERYLVQNPPGLPLTTKEMDRIYSLPYERNWHTKYDKSGGVPAIEEVKFSIVSHRGCIGNCSFCALNFHQGRIIQKRSKASIVNEAKKLTWMPDFKGYIHDVGGPTANFRNFSCKKNGELRVCKNRSCLFPKPCKNLVVDHEEYLLLLKEIRKIDGIKKVFIRSGIRYDYLILDKKSKFFDELIKHHISGQLKVAPEHVSDSVLKKMSKPSVDAYNQFVTKYKELNKKYNKDQYLVPYFISSHPGSTVNDALMLYDYLKKNHVMPEQVQAFYPTPGTVSTCMYYTGLDPRDLSPVYVPKTAKERAIQRALLQYGRNENQKILSEVLKKGTNLDKKKKTVNFRKTNDKKKSVKKSKNKIVKSQNRQEKKKK